MSGDWIKIRGAREHNLKNIDLDIPKNSLVVVTGLSGAGKSSLAFDIIYAEGQRRFIESMSLQARQYLRNFDKPNVDKIEGLSPTIALEQGHGNVRSSSTVSSLTEIDRYLQVFYAGIGVPFDPKTGDILVRHSIDEILSELLDFKESIKMMILAPLSSSENLERIMRMGFLRVRIKGEVFEIEEILKRKSLQNDLELIVDRLVLRDGETFRNRLQESLELGLRIGNQLVKVSYMEAGEWHDKEFTSNFFNPKTGYILSNLKPNNFSKNSAHGACRECSGLGIKREFSGEKFLYNIEKSIIRGGLRFIWAEKNMQEIELEELKNDLGIALDIAISNFSKKDLEKILLYKEKKAFSLEKNSSSKRLLKRLEKFKSKKDCSACKGSGIRDEFLHIKLSDKNIQELEKMNISTLVNFFKNELVLPDKKKKLFSDFKDELIERLLSLESLGLGYIEPSRTAGTLSGGELQRVRLATQISAKLGGVIYVLDEPSVGLHSSDTNKLLKSLRDLCDLGNTVILVEHDEDCIQASDWVVEIGPEAGANGGNLIASNQLDNLDKKSITKRFLSERFNFSDLKSADFSNFFEIKGASQNNLKNIDVRFPKNSISCVVGASGSGKSTLILDTLFPAVQKKLNLKYLEIGKFTEIKNIDFIKQVISIDQKPLGKSIRSNPASYCGFLKDIRVIFSKLPEAKILGYNAERFSFNIRGGRCETCQGTGQVRLDLHFMGDVYAKCESCEGKRFNKTVLNILFKGKNIADILELTVDEAFDFFQNQPKIHASLALLIDSGLGYIRLGQPSSTLSGGEAQRLRLVKLLGKQSSADCLLILDEPSTGLHFYDIQKLMGIFRALQRQGATILLIEHNLDIVKQCDWLVELGPIGGPKGGEVIFSGSPAKIISSKKSVTGKLLGSRID